MPRTTRSPWTTRSTIATASEPVCSRVLRRTRMAAIPATIAHPMTASQGSSRSVGDENAAAR